MILDVDPASPVPAYEQVRSQLAEMILAGALPAGHRLPPIRQLAADLGLAPGTVGRVYQELEASGLVISRVRHGTTVAAGIATLPDGTVSEGATPAVTFGISIDIGAVPRREGDQTRTSVSGASSSAPAKRNTSGPVRSGSAGAGAGAVRWFQAAKTRWR